MGDRTGKKLLATDWILMLVLVLAGGFHEYIACLISVPLCLYLGLRLSKNRILILPKGLLGLAVAAICLGYGVSAFWAVDRGMAFVGFWKFLPVGLYYVCLKQETDRKQILELLPAVGAILTVITAGLMQIPMVRGLFSVAGRLAGTFQYPNTFALFLLICQLLLWKKPGLRGLDYGILAVLIGGMLYTGSRTVFVLFLLSNFLAFFLSRQKWTRVVLAGVLGGLILAGGAAVLLGGEDSVFYRYLSISLTESTFAGRLLYMRDALPLVLKHPFGLGYMGYYYAQSGIQTGVYAVAYVHNDFLQLLLDVGWLPAGLLIGALIWYVLRRELSWLEKLPVLVLCAHSFFDFDLQFAGMFFLLLLLVEDPKEKTLVVKKGVPGMAVLLAILGAGSLYMAAGLGLSNYGYTQAAEALYPCNTRNKLAILEQTEDLEEAKALAQEILAQNSSCHVPYSVLAKYAYAKGDIETVIHCKNAVFQRYPFGYEEYEEYCVMLINCIARYQSMGDRASVKVCQSLLLETQKALAANQDRLSTLGRMIVDQPITKLSEDVSYYIAHMEVEQ